MKSTGLDNISVCLWANENKHKFSMFYYGHENIKPSINNVYTFI